MGGGGGGHRFLDRSKVRILLCDPKSSQEVLHLLSKCSHQVTSVRSARQLIDVLRAQAADIDIILAEVDLPIAKGFKMLKYITRDKDLRRIPIIMMSSQDEVSVVVKCLRLGPADYLVKPLRTNELLNLWTHMWRRRRTLGLSEKEVFNHDFELALSDPSDANANSTTLLSDDTDDKLKGNSNQETGTSNHREYEASLDFSMHLAYNSVALSYFISLIPLVLNPGVLAERNRRQMLQWVGVWASFSGGVFSFPKKTNLRVGEPSAFLAYVKSTPQAKNSNCTQLDGNAGPSEPTKCQDNLHAGSENERIKSRGAHERCSEENEAFQMPTEFTPVCFSSSSTQPESSSEGQNNVSGAPSVFHFPFYYPGMMPSSVHMFQGCLNNVQAHSSPVLLLQYNALPHLPVMPSIPYNHVGVNLQSGHMPATNVWPSVTSTSLPEAKSGRTERRAAALVKFRQKRKERCFDKKIGYVNRKHLAETRPRVRGQFVRHANNVDIQLGGLNAGDDNAEEDEDEEPTSRELELVSSPEYNTRN
ncbi:Two-component response regulator-like PRR1 [Ananas comosus]|uniref:Two-component response regulator-like PRR1 n=1 Tax=Ananas comosus TaxID=4615 RepID=A0A199VVB1_ANACO|nr:Two-component response regulator-like PRR1 [Ananas comosus]